MPCAPVDTDTLSTDDMHVAYARAAGLDVHKMRITATVRLCEAGSGPSRTATREFGALPDGLRGMTDWLRGHGVTAAAHIQAANPCGTLCQGLCARRHTCWSSHPPRRWLRAA